ncbi:hypothetical protein P389DRAFT_197367 [Cystobasidium minutum MCA 4210]|uniref:uncharacterized protein n=1 Tax=Cystobasidium minutum MCA 4210 TaxID=1397322 RepID=UPI0034CEB1B6|eukprot:jgi/Rhomi1/197367/gm1.5581_g
MSEPDVYEWTVRIVMDRNALGGSFGTVVFLLSPEEAKRDTAESLISAKPSEWSESPHYVGRVAALPTSMQSTGESGEQPQMMQGFVHLDTALRRNLGKTDIESVVPYLKEALFWKVNQPDKKGIKAEDEELDLDELPSFEVAVMSAKLKKQTGLFPEYESPVIHREITAGKKGGIKK